MTQLLPSATPPLLRAASENPFFSVDPGMVIWTWITFFLVFLILLKFAWKPILKALDEREGRIKDSLEKAEQVEAQARELTARNEAVVHQANEKAKRVLEEARSAGLELKAQLEAQGKKEVEQMVEKTRLALQQEKKAAVDELKKQSAELAVTIAGRLLEEKLTDEKDRSLAEKYLNEVEKF